MPNYEKMYFTLFSAVCDAIDALEETNYDSAKEILIRAQQQTEEIYISTETEQ